MASGWPSGGSTSPATPTRSASTATRTSGSFPTATTSSTRSTPTSRSTSSPASSSPATCCPTPRTEQLVATGYNRLNMMTREGGAQPEEYLAKYGAERVRSVAAAWFGSTFGCAECHDHKFDPITARDFYELQAFFADVKQWGVYSNYGYTPEPELRGFNNESSLSAGDPGREPVAEDSGTTGCGRQLADELAAAANAAGRRSRGRRGREAGGSREAESFLETHPDGWLAAGPGRAAGRQGGKPVDGPSRGRVGRAGPSRPTSRSAATRRSRSWPTSVGLGTLAAIRLTIARPRPLEPEASGPWPRAADRRSRWPCSPPRASREPVKLAAGEASVHSGRVYRSGFERAGPRQRLAAAVRAAGGRCRSRPSGSSSPSRSRRATGSWSRSAARAGCRWRWPSARWARSSRWRPPRRATSRPSHRRRRPASPGAGRPGQRAVPAFDGPDRAGLRPGPQASARSSEGLFGGRAWTLVTEAVAEPLTVRVLPRGNWQDESGPVVLPATPALPAGPDREHRAEAADAARSGQLARLRRQSDHRRGP